MFSIVYAIARSGRREFAFSSATALAEHVQENAPYMWAGAPEYDDKYEDNMEEKRSRGWKMPEKKR